MSSCRIGSTLGDNSNCNELIPRDMLSNEELRTLKLRASVKKKIKFICQNHYKKFYTNYPFHQGSCCNPFGLHSSEHPPGNELNAEFDEPPQKKAKTSSKRSLFEISLDIRDKGKPLGLSLIPGQKLCVKCKIHLYGNLRTGASSDEPPEFVLSSPSIPSSQSQVSTQSHSTPPSTQKSSQRSDEPFQETFDALNSWLSSHGLSPVSQQKMKQQQKYPLSVVENFKSALQNYTDTPLTENISQEELTDLQKKVEYYYEIINQLKEYYFSTEKNSQKVLALTALPKSWSLSMISEEFGASNRLARKTKALVSEKGILSNPDPKPGKKLSAETVELVQSFYLRMNNSRELPGKKDVVSVKVNGTRVYKRKRLVLTTLHKLHLLFCDEFKDHKISRGKFCALRPRECVLAGSAGTHTVCVCVHHQNPKLMFKGSTLKESDDMKSISDCLKLLICTEPTVDCYLKNCENCPGTLQLQEKLELYFDSEMIENITYNQWESTDRSSIETLTKPTSDFIDDFIIKLEKLVTHDFIATQQSSFFNDKLKNLQEGEVIVMTDFAENYSFIIQDSAQSYYFNNKQATIHPFMCYYGKRNETSGAVEAVKLPFVVISDHMDHSTTAVYAFQKQLIDFLKNTIKGQIKKIYYFSDGSAAQYKNKKAMANLWFHERDFGIPAEWHFFATSHGKSPCDGLGGTVKREAYLYSIRAIEPGTQITSPILLYYWLLQNITGMSFAYVSSDNVKALEATLKVRFDSAYSIIGIQSHHAFIPSNSEAKIEMKTHSNSNTGEYRKICSTEISPDFGEVAGFVIFSNQGKWHLGYVADKHADTSSFTIQSLVQHKKKKNHFYFEDDDQEGITVYLQDVLLTVTPSIHARGQTYRLSAEDIVTANAKQDAHANVMKG